MDKYNGWTNIETWKVNLWLTSDSGLAKMTDEIVSSSGSPTQLQDAVEEVLLENVEGLARDLLISSIAKVNWEEIIEQWKE